MADGIVQVPPDSTGKKVDAASLDVGAATVYRQRIVIGDNSASAQFAIVTGGALTVAGTMNISAMPTVTVTGAIGISGTATVAGSVGATVTGLVGLTAGAANIGFINHISRTIEVAISTPFTINNISASVAVTGNFSATSTVVIAAGAANIGTINNISATVNVAGTFTISTIDAISATVQVAISTPFTINNISATVNAAVIIGSFRDPSGDLRNLVDSANLALRVNVVAGAGAGANPVSIAAGTSNIGFINNISATVIVAGVVSFAANQVIDSISKTINVAFAGGISLAAGTANIGFINNISATVTIAGNVNLSLTANVVVGAGVSNIGFINNISATVNTVIGAGTSNIGFINNISATVNTVIGAGTANIGAVSNAAGTALMGAVSLAAGTANIGFINNISATVVVSGLIGLTAGSSVIGDINAISRTVQVAIATPFILQGISTTIQVAVATPFILQGISTTVSTICSAQVAHDASVTAGVVPVQIAVRANLSSPSVVANADASYLWSDLKGRLIVGLNHPAILPSASHGPKCVTCSTSAGIALIAAPGAGLAIYITKIACTNGSATLTRGDVFQASATASCTMQMYMAANGGGFTMDYNPPIQVQSNTGVTCRVKPSVSKALYNVHFYVGAK